MGESIVLSVNRGALFLTALLNTNFQLYIVISGFH